jgi:hypothetical protein
MEQGVSMPQTKLYVADLTKNSPTASFTAMLEPHHFTARTRRNSAVRALD